MEIQNVLCPLSKILPYTCHLTMIGLACMGAGSKPNVSWLLLYPPESHSMYVCVQCKMNELFTVLSCIQGCSATG